MYRAQHRGRDVAVKRIVNVKPDVPADGVSWDPATYFRREVELLRAVRHPNVLRFRVRPRRTPAAEATSALSAVW